MQVSKSGKNFFILFIIVENKTEMEKQTRQAEFRLNFKCWIERTTGENILGEGKWRLLKAIQETGSLKAASEQMGYAYRQTWESLKTIEERLGFKLIEKTRGGAAGGHTLLTREGEMIVTFFDRLYDEIEPGLQKHFAKMVQELEDLRLGK